MREWNALRRYPQPEYRLVGERTIEDRIIASYRGVDFFDGPRSCGYGGLRYDGRWKAVAQDICTDYLISSVIELQCEKGFLLKELEDMAIEVCGVDNSMYARRCAALSGIKVVPSIPENTTYDLCIARGVVYTLPLSAAMDCIRRIEALAHKAFIVLASYETREDFWLFKRWSLLACTILKKEEWREVLKHCGYTGDYWFVNAETLRLREATDQ